jgi:hypothetical protein
MTETINSSETSVLTTATRRDIPQDGIPEEDCFHSNRRENLKPYIDSINQLGSIVEMCLL